MLHRRQCAKRATGHFGIDGRILFAAASDTAFDVRTDKATENCTTNRHNGDHHFGVRSQCRGGATNDGKNGSHPKCSGLEFVFSLRVGSLYQIWREDDVFGIANPY